MLFRGSIRENIDPGRLFPDSGVASAIAGNDPNSSSKNTKILFAFKAHIDNAFASDSGLLAALGGRDDIMGSTADCLSAGATLRGVALLCSVFCHHHLICDMVSFLRHHVTRVGWQGKSSC